MISRILLFGLRGPLTFHCLHLECQGVDRLLQRCTDTRVHVHSIPTQAVKHWRHGSATTTERHRSSPGNATAVRDPAGMRTCKADGVCARIGDDDICTFPHIQENVFACTATPTQDIQQARPLAVRHRTDAGSPPHCLARLPFLPLSLAHARSHSKQPRSLCSLCTPLSHPTNPCARVRADTNVCARACACVCARVCARAPRAASVLVIHQISRALAFGLDVGSETRCIAACN